ncbi:hypothetical protein [Sinorhizobium fredii]|uniref:hypothetical protein n=1 Tax=Rhizobium fredii TaxID=380 RepID=UPI0004BC8D5A|nr:hypothetical protein [Sinorhizobium fredii]
MDLDAMGREEAQGIEEKPEAGAPRLVGKDFRKDWAAALEVFRASLPRRRQGQPAGGTKRGIIPVVPHKANKKQKPSPRPFTEDAPVEQAVGELKRFKRVALRCEKTKRNFASIVALTAGFILVGIRPHRPIH